MASQTGKNLYVAYMVEATLNTVPGTTTGAELLRLSESPGLGLTMPTVLPTEIRRDMLTVMGRLGSRSVAGSFNGDLSVNSWDTLLEAAMRSTWATADTLNTDDVDNVTVTGHQVLGDGDWVEEGIRVGDVFRISGLAATADNNRNLRVKAVSSAAIDVVETLTAEATALTTYTLTRIRKLNNATTPVRRSFHVEQRYQDIEESLVAGGCRVGGFTIRGTPDGMASIEVRMAGMSQRVEDGAAVFTDLKEYTTDPLVFTDARIALGGEDIAVATSFELVGELGGETLPVLGSDFSPDVFDNEFVVNGSLSLLREDLDRVKAFTDEDEFELHVLLEEPSGDPRKALGIFVPRLKFTGVDAPLGQDGGMIETVPFIVGLKAAVGAYEQTMMKFATETPA